MSDHKQRIGRWGEAKAASYLEGQGYSLPAHNVRTPYGEIDLVAMPPNDQPEQVVFIEVKARTSTAFGPPEVSVNERKRQHLLQACQYYIQQHPELPGSYRIDVIAIRRLAGRPPEIFHFENAIS